MTGTVLIVTDDEDLRTEAKYGFPTGIDAVLMYDGREASARLSEVHPVAVVLEIRTGTAGGFDLARQLRQRASTRDVPILMILEREQDRWLASQAGATKAWVQPIDTSDLVVETLALIASKQPQSA